MRVLDTSFLIDLQREWTGNREGGATRFLRAHAREGFAISSVTAVEFLEGYESLSEGERFLEPYQWIEVNPNIARAASRIRRRLRQVNVPIGDFGIIIAATALELEAPLVTADIAHFQPIHELVVDSYR